MTNTIVVKNSRNSTVATITQGTFDTSSPITMAGRGANGFALTNNQDFYWLMENFANSTPPVNPVEGMIWYDPSSTMKYRTTSTWISFANGSNSDIILPRLSGASNINLNSVATYSVHTGATGVKTMVTGLLIVPRTGASVAGAPPAIALEVTTSTGDVADKIILRGLDSSTKFFRYNIAGSQRIVQAGDTVKLSVKTAIVGGDTLSVDAYLYGITI